MRISTLENNGRKLVWKERRVQRHRSVKAFISPNKGKKNTGLLEKTLPIYGSRWPVCGLSYKKRYVKGVV